MSRYRILITGVGSLVGKGLLDALEGRRESLWIMGTTFGLDAPGVYRCDEAFLTEPSESPAFPAQIRQIVDRVRPDIVIPGRDPDVAVVAALDVASLTGSAQAAAICWDKWLTYEFAADRGLPIIDTALPGAADYGPPAIAKPRSGSGSLGVKLLLNEAAWQRAQQLNGYVLQPLIGPVPPEIDPADGLPLFWSAQIARQGGVQGIIDPDGNVGVAAAFETLMQFGWVRSQWLSDDSGLLAVGMAWLSAMAEAGARGPLNISCLHDGRSWQVMELNPRFSGGTSSRTLCGFDEVGWALNRWAGRDVVPSLTNPPAGSVVSDLAPYPLRHGDIEQLRGGHWVKRAD